jgi:hypothetical protein
MIEALALFRVFGSNRGRHGVLSPPGIRLGGEQDGCQAGK